MMAKKLLLQPSLYTPPPQWEESDIYDYGVERLLLVEHDLLVDLLVQNGFHAQERTLVLSENGYPSYLLPVARRFLEENSQLPVYFLHDATEHGAQMAARLAPEEVLPLAGHPILDLGLFPEDVKRMHGQRAMQPRRTRFAIPVDYLLFPTLGVWMAHAMVANLAFGDLLAQVHHETFASGASMDFG